MAGCIGGGEVLLTLLFLRDLVFVRAGPGPVLVPPLEGGRERDLDLLVGWCMGDGVCLLKWEEGKLEGGCEEGVVECCC